jgi:formate dehydrogenase subunit delta
MAGAPVTRDDLVRMANQIAANFRHHGTDVAAGEVAGHLRRFWSTSMRAEFLAGQDTTGLDPIVVAAKELLRSGATGP